MGVRAKIPTVATLVRAWQQVQVIKYICTYIYTRIWVLKLKRCSSTDQALNQLKQSWTSNNIWLKRLRGKAAPGAQTYICTCVICNSHAKVVLARRANIRTSGTPFRKALQLKITSHYCLYVCIGSLCYYTSSTDCLQQYLRFITASALHMFDYYGFYFSCSFFVIFAFVNARRATNCS